MKFHKLFFALVFVGILEILFLSSCTSEHNMSVELSDQEQNMQELTINVYSDTQKH